MSDECADAKRHSSLITLVSSLTPNTRGPETPHHSSSPLQSIRARERGESSRARICCCERSERVLLERRSLRSWCCLLRRRHSAAALQSCIANAPPLRWFGKRSQEEQCLRQMKFSRRSCENRERSNRSSRAAHFPSTARRR